MPTFTQYLKAAYPLIWVNTLEPHRAERDLAACARAARPGSSWAPLHWDIIDGLRAVGEPPAANSNQPPMKVVQTVSKTMKEATVFLWNLHRFLGAADLVQALQNAIPDLKSNGSCLVVLAPDADKLPQELARHFAVMDFALPGREAILETAARMLEGASLEGPVPEGLAEAAMGLTQSEAEDAMALALVEAKRLAPEVVAREKAGALLRQAKIELSSFTERFDGLGGLQVIKSYALRAIASPMAKGILLVGPPGTGKSHFAKALGNEVGRPVLSMDFGRQMSGLVGSSEANFRATIAAANAMGKTVIIVDELEKQLAGVQGSGELDSGVKAGLGAAFLQWVEGPRESYLVGTANDITQLQPAYLRAGRWDAIFFIDLPDDDERSLIWSIYERRYALEAQKRPMDTGWSGSEIHTCCRTAVMLGCDLLHAAQFITPMSITMAEQIEATRSWARGRAIPASAAAMAAAPARRLAL